ncbi:MAG: small multi-drug export protein [Pygmaiobacter sp.]
MIALIKEYFWILLISMVPIVELRGAVPIGIAMGNLPLLGVYLAAILGNMLPVPIILLFAKKILIWCTTLPYVGKFFNFIYEKGLKAGETLQKKAGRGLYFALFIFVAIPLPGTGAWTGCLAATLLDMKLVPSILAVLAGVLTAGLIMGALSLGVFGGLGLLLA